MFSSVVPKPHSHSLPVALGRRFQIDGAEYTQSVAMLTYAGKIGGLYPEDALTALKVFTYIHEVLHR